MNVLAGLQADGAALSDDVTTAMYAEDPFWTERYGARGGGTRTRTATTTSPTW